MPAALDAVLVVILILAAGVWIGGYAAVVMVSIVSARTLDGAARVRFFRRFGAVYFMVTGSALLVTYAVGWTFLARLPWSGELTRMAIGSALLLLVLVAGIVQARDLRRRRERAAAEPADEALVRSIRRRAMAAAILRGLIGLLTLGLTIHVALLLTGIG